MSLPRLAPLLGGLTLAADAANGFPPEKVLRTVLFAITLGRALSLSDDQLRDIYYLIQLRYLGCTAFAHEEAYFYGAGDDLSVRNTMSIADAAQPLDLIGRLVRGIAPEAALSARASAVSRLLTDKKVIEAHARAQCEVSERLAEMIGFSREMRTALSQICERFDGRGAPNRLKGDDVGLAIRIFHLSDVAEVVFHRHGREAVQIELAKRAGGHLDPALTRLVLADPEPYFRELEHASVWDRFLEREPPPYVTADPRKSENVARAFALFADMKSTFTLGHSIGVADLVDRAASSLSIAGEERQRLRIAALLHDLGRVGVANEVWDKKGPLNRSEWERVRLHSYHTERILSHSSALKEIAAIAAAAHERCDGCGYHRGVPKTFLGKGARLIAAADAYHAMLEPRPHRAALTRAASQKELEQDVKAGKLDAEAVSAILAAAGERASTIKAAHPCGLSDREVEVLRLLARGSSNKDIACTLDISPRTVQHHVEHIYDKIDVSSRAAAALFAIEHALVD